MNSSWIDSFLIKKKTKQRTDKKTETKTTWHEKCSRKRGREKHTLRQRGHFLLAAATSNPFIIVTEAAEQQHM
jgi:hypothetical protein